MRTHICYQLVVEEIFPDMGINRDLAQASAQSMRVQRSARKYVKQMSKYVVLVKLWKQFQCFISENVVLSACFCRTNGVFNWFPLAFDLATE